MLWNYFNVIFSTNFMAWNYFHRVISIKIMPANCMRLKIYNLLSMHKSV
jgi:hypothetical protein